MGTFSKLRLSYRIYLQQALILVALIGLAIYSVSRVTYVDNEMGIIGKDIVPMCQNAATAVQSRLLEDQELSKIEQIGPAVATSDSARATFHSEVDKLDSYKAAADKSLKAADEADKDATIAYTGTEDEEIVKDYGVKLSALNERQARFDKDVDQLIHFYDDGKVNPAQEYASRLAADQADDNKAGDDLLGLMDDAIKVPVENTLLATTTLREVLLWLGIIVVVTGILMLVLTGATLRSLRQSIAKIGNSVQQTASASTQSSNAISLVADGAKQQSQAIAQAVTAVNQSVSVLSHVSKNAEGATKLTKEAASTVSDGRKQMEDMVAVVNRIADNSARINKITDVINNIANQTNMLSLNAAIEAARAGEHGKGFAVVADQVRKLAESSRSSVQEIVELIAQATNDAKAAVAAAGRVNEEMGKIADSADNTEKMMQSIATSMEQQVATTEELQHNMDTLKGIGESNTSAAEEITQTVLELSRTADETNVEVSKFNI